jgi:hypothetical protein
LALLLWVVMLKLVKTGMKYTKCSSFCHQNELCHITETGVCDYLEKEMYGIQVVFNERGYWSKAYTYISETPISKGAIVVVPTNTFYGVGKVTDSIKDYAFKPNITYKQILKVLDVL